MILTDSKKGALFKLIQTIGFSFEVIGTLDELKSEMRKFRPNYLISCGWPYLLPEKVFNLSSKCSLNCHSSLLPDYKGASAFKHYWSNWEKKAGATVHIISKKFDDGSIMASASFDIPTFSSPKWILKKSSKVTCYLIIKAIHNFEKGDSGEVQKGGRYFYKISNFKHVLYWLYNGFATYLGFAKKMTPHKKLNEIN